MPVNDVYEIVLTTTLFSQECKNVFYYLGLSADATTENMAQTFGFQKIPDLQNVTSSSLNFTSVRAVNMSSAEPDFTYIPLSASGSVSGDCLPSYNAWGFELVVNSAFFRNGAKRIAGVPESWTQNGAIVSAFEATMTTTAGVMLSPLTFGGVDMGQLGLYREDLVSSAYAPVVDVVYKRMTTQNSRKPF